MQNKTDFVTLSMLKEMIAFQESAFRASTQLIIEGIRISKRFTSEIHYGVSEKK